MTEALSRGWVGLMRHAAAWYDGMPDDKRFDEYPELTVKGASAARDVGEGLRRFLEDVGVDPTEVAVHDVGTPQSIATAKIVRKALRHDESGNEEGEDASLPPLTCLGPNALATYSAHLEDVGNAWSDTAEERKRAGADQSVIVGHDPQISWLLHHLGGRQTRWRLLRHLGGRRTRWLTFAPGELILLEPHSEGTGGAARYRPPRFILSPTDSTTSDKVREKIKSKMDTAKVLGTFLTALVTFAATQVLGREDASARSTVFATVGLTMLAAATVLYFITLFSYDELLMPKRFWAVTLPRRAAARVPRERHVLRPPASDTWVLYENMLRVWTRAFIPATVLAGAGVTALTLALADPSGWSWGIAAISVAAVTGIAAIFRHLARPRLGVND